MSEPQAPASPEHRKPAKPSVLWRALHRLARLALRDELAAMDARATGLEAELRAANRATAERLEAEIGALKAALDSSAEQAAGALGRLGDDLKVVHRDARRDIESIAADTRALQGAHDELQKHLETRLDQAAAEVADVRGGLLASREELGALRDGALPRLSAKLDELVDSSGRVATTLQRELEGIRDLRVPALEQAFAGFQGALDALGSELQGLRDRRVPVLEEGLGSVQTGLGRLQAELEGIRDRRLGGVESDLGRLQLGLSRLQTELEGVRDGRVVHLEGDLKRLQADLEALLREVEAVRDDRLFRVETDLGELQAGLGGVLSEVEEVRDQRLPALLEKVSRAESAVAGVQALGEELRDRRLPALDGRVSALIGRLHEDLAATAGLVDRLCLGEPLHVAVAAETEASLPEAIRSASRLFIDEFRGSEAQVAVRLEEYLPLLGAAGPVLDLGCGRGELLAMLQRQGVEAWGVDSDPAMVAACTSQGLDVRAGEANEALESVAPGSLGAVTAIQLLEHLPAASWMRLLESAARALRSGGLVLVECPNPGSLRVGGSLFWLDPTHRAPVHPEALAFAARALGLEVSEVRFLHAFPPEQNLAREGQTDELHELAERLDDWLSAPRDFLLIARKP